MLVDRAVAVQAEAPASLGGDAATDDHVAHLSVGKRTSSFMSISSKEQTSCVGMFVRKETFSSDALIPTVRADGDGEVHSGRCFRRNGSRSVYKRGGTGPSRYKAHGRGGVRTRWCQAYPGTDRA